MMKGYLTVFLSLSLSFLTGFVLLLTGNAIRNAWKIRLEGAADLGMNSVLAEYQIDLHDRYGLLYVDASYGGKEPSHSNMEERLFLYISQNTEKGENGPFGNIVLTDVELIQASSAAAEMGSSMKNQAVCYVEDCGLVKEEVKVASFLSGLSSLSVQNAEEEWSALMEQIAGMELPRILNEEGIWEEVPLANPADGVYALLGSDVLYLADADLSHAGVWQIRKADYISERIQSGKAKENLSWKRGDLQEEGFAKTDTETFLVYLFEKMGNYRNIKKDCLLQCQLEYIAMGKASDYENLQAVTEQLFEWQFAANVSYLLADAGRCQEAEEIALTLHAVQLDESFKEPVTKSILYAWAYLETIGDVKCLLKGGRVEISKSSFETSIGHVLSCIVPASSEEGAGLSYEQYLACMLLLLSEDTRNLRSMDIMEMDIRSITGNTRFAMDFCIERYQTRIKASGNLPGQYELIRSYGYY